MTFLSCGREGFYIKSKLKSEILNDKKNPYKPKCLSAITKNLNWQMLTKNLILKDRMEVKMKNVNIMGFHQFLGEGRGHPKKQYIWGIDNKYGEFWYILVHPGT